ncbi:MAG: hypothetical protein ABIQ35_02240 [Verrucomicrobiota bacterium]
MNSDLPPPISPPAGDATRKDVPKRRRWLLWGCGGLLAFLLVIVATVAITLWWIQRPIKPVVLSASEKSAVDQKLEHLNGRASENRSRTPTRRDDSSKPEPDRPYTVGSRELRLTERELNGLLNANTDLGKTVRLEFGRDAINAYLAVPIPADFPVGGGKMFRARGRFRISLSPDEAPFAVLEDVTVLGVSLPKAWLGGLKGENLLADAMGGQNGRARFSGIKSLHVVPGAIVLEVNE